MWRNILRSLSVFNGKSGNGYYKSNNLEVKNNGGSKMRIEQMVLKRSIERTQLQIGGLLSVIDGYIESQDAERQKDDKTGIGL